MAVNGLKVIDTIDLVDSNDEDEVKIIGQGTKRKIVEVDLNEDLVIGVVDGAVPEPDLCVKRLKKNEVRSASEETEKGRQLVDYVVDDISPYHWTPDMRKFYNKLSPKKLKYSIRRVLNSMSNGPHLWRVQGCSKFVTDNRSQRFERLGKANNCYMCGTEGHKVKYCPNRKCLTCGKTTPSSFVATCGKCLEFKERRCSRCKLIGHSVIDCTDHWRRFHNVTALQRIEPPSGTVYKDSRNLWCCNCGRKGHVHEQCWTRGDFTPFAPTSTFVSSYERAFPGDRAEANEEPRCDYVLCTAMDKVTVPKSQPREKLKPVKKLNRYFVPENNSGRPQNQSPSARKLNGKERRELRRADKAKKLQNLEAAQNLQNQQCKKKKKRNFGEPFQNLPVKKKKKKKLRLDQPVQNQPDRQKKKSKRSPASAAIAINRWNNFLMGFSKI